MSKNDNTKLEEAEKEIVFDAVVYTDGAAGPTNPGFYGSGVHGYIYRDEDIEVKNTDTPPAGNSITTMGYTNKPIGTNQTVKAVKPFEYFNGMFAYGYETGTNNIGEILATTKMIKYLLDHHYKYKSILIKTDSTYVEGIFYKLKNKDKINFDYRNIPNLKNVDYYEIIDNLLNEATENGIEIKIRKTPAHADSLGNNLADALAVTARLNSANGVEGDFVKFYEGKKYWKPTIDKHPLLRVNQLFYTHADREKIGKCKYIIMDYDKDIEVGKKTHGAMFGLVELKKDNVLDIEKLIDIDKEKQGTTSILSTIDLLVYYGQFHHVFKELGDDLIYTERKNHIEVMNTAPIVSPVYPQGLAKTSLDKALTLDETLNNYKLYRDSKLTNSDELFYIDITDTIYDVTEKKHVTKLDMKDKLIKTTFKVGEKSITLTIPLKREILDRNTLKQIEKRKPKVFVEVTIQNSRSLTYNTIVDLGDEIGVYTNFYTTNTII